MSEYILTNKAVDDLAQIWNYTFEVWSENHADKYYNMLIDACKNLAASPQSGKNYYEISKDIFGYKAGKHIIFYSQINDGKIEVVRILHSSMDLKSRL